MFWWGIITAFAFLLVYKWLKRNLYRKFLSSYRKLKIKIDDITLSTDAIQHSENLEGLHKMCVDENVRFIENFLIEQEGIKIVSSLEDQPDFIIRIKFTGECWSGGSAGDSGTVNFALWKKVQIIVTDSLGNERSNGNRNMATMDHLAGHVRYSIESIFTKEKWKGKK